MDKKLSIVIPVYFNAPSLPVLHEELLKLERSLAERGVALELIFVDDGSGDDSMRKLLEIKRKTPSVKLIRLTRNFGAVHASKTGFSFVTGDCFMILAADLQDPPELALEMVDRWLAGSKFIICERITRDDPFVSKFFAKIYYRLLKLLVMRDFPEGGYDMGLMDKTMLPHLVNSSKNMHTPLLAYWLGYKPDVIHYHRRPRLHGKSRWTFGKKVKSFLDVMLGFSVTPIRAISAFGTLISIGGFLYGCSVLIGALLFNNSVRGFPTLVALITFLLGIIILMLGVIGEYMWRIFDETNKRPEAVIDEIY
jgi:dolichol-phosphate mannosyltransferase